MMEIQIELNSGTKIFDNFEEYKKWYDTSISKNSMRFLFNEISTSFTRIDFSKKIKNMDEEKFNSLHRNLTDALQKKDEVQIKNKVNELQNYYRSHKNNILTANMPIINYIQNISKEENNTTGVFVLMMYLNIDYQFNCIAAFNGALRYNEFKKGESDITIESHNKSMEDLYKLWQNKLSEQTALAKSSIETVNTTSSNLDEQLETQKSTFKTFIETSTEEIAHLEEVYDKKLALRASVEYWREKKENHFKWMKNIGKLLIFSIFFFVCFIFFILPENMENLVHIGVLVFSSVFGGWGITLISKIFISQFHLWDDAYGREVRMLTFLALLKEETMESSDKQLILQALFVPCSSGLIKDTGPVTTYDAINRLLKKP